MKNGILFAILVVTGLLGIGNLVLMVGASAEVIQNMQTIVTGGLLLGMTILFVGLSIYLIKAGEGKFNRVLAIVNVVLCLFLVGNVAIVSEAVTLPSQEYVPDFTNMSIVDVTTWAEEQGIEIQQNDVYSDTVEEYYVVGQNVSPNTLVKNVETMDVSVSVGPNFDVVVSLTNMVGWSYDEVMEYVSDLHLNNMSFDFKVDEEIAKDILMSQSKSGDVKRRDEIALEFSLGPKGSLQPVAMEDFFKQTVLQASNWLKRYGIDFKVVYEFSSDIDRGLIMAQDIAKGQETDPYNDTLTLTVSKGVEVVIPEFSTMSKDDILRWAIDSKVKVTFSEAYDDSIAEGNVIKANKETGDKVEQDSTIKVTLSKGPITMLSFKSLSEFKTWANNYGIPFSEIYEYSDSVAKGGVISFSVAAGTILKNGQGVTVKVSQGKAVTIPNFVGKTQAQIQSECSSIGLSCSFTQGGYNAAAKGTAISQNKGAGSVVVSGTSITITLSGGPASSFTLIMQESMLQPGSAPGTISSLKSNFASKYPGVNFNFVTRAHSTLSPGLIHPDSPTKTGSSVTQGQTYTIIVTG
ncbi:MAG: PASTA domain-containing protein [Erysipelotrichaceae bacterium]